MHSIFIALQNSISGEQEIYAVTNFHGTQRHGFGKEPTYCRNVLASHKARSKISCAKKILFVDLFSNLPLYFVYMSKPSLKSVLNKKSVYKISGTLWIEYEGPDFFRSRQS